MRRRQFGPGTKVTVRNKFYLLDYHYSKDMYEEGHVHFRWVPGENNLVDIMTKSLTPVLLETFHTMVCGYSVSQWSSWQHQC